MCSEKTISAETADTLKVQMLGDFSVSFGKNSLSFKTGNTTKVMQIFQLLLFSYPNSVTKSSIFEKIFEYDDILNPNNNLKVSISQLRSSLAECGLPCEEFIKFKNNSYSWVCPLPMDVDVHIFEETAKRGLTAKSSDIALKTCIDAINLYNGNFLPELVGIDWVEKLSAYYYDLYANAVRLSANALMEAENYRECFDLYSKAFQFRHDEEWQIGKIKCMMKLGQWEDAKSIYQATVASLEREFNVGPSEELLKEYRLISERTDNAFSSFENMLNIVKEASDTRGAYYCTFPSFVDSCRVLSRNMERSGISCFLMMLFLGDTKGNAIKSDEKLSAGSEALFNSIQISLRKGDSFTQYNKSQFLVFLFGTSRENCDVVAKRITNNFKKAAVRGAQVRYEVTSGILNQLENLT